MVQETHVKNVLLKSQSLTEYKKTPSIINLIQKPEPLLDLGASEILFERGEDFW